MAGWSGGRWNGYSTVSLPLIAVLISLLGAYHWIDGFASSDSEETAKEDTMKAAKTRGYSSTPNPSITVIYDNNAYAGKSKPEWGFACLIQIGDTNVLFDTGGDGSILMHNMSQLGIDPTEIDIVVLSHEHWDHVSGLQDFLEEHSRVAVYVPESFSDEFKQRARRSGARLIAVSESISICGNVLSTGAMGTQVVEQSLIVLTDAGSIVITGCAHPGIVEILERTKELVDGNVLLAMGGFHLINHSRSQVNSIVKRFRELQVRCAGPCHCTGDAAREVFREEYKEDFIDIGTGRVISLAELD